MTFIRHAQQIMVARLDFTGQRWLEIVAIITSSAHIQTLSVGKGNHMVLRKQIGLQHYYFHYQVM